MTGRKPSGNSSAGLFGTHRPQSYDLWGRPVDSSASGNSLPLGSWRLGALFSRSKLERAALERRITGRKEEDGVISRPEQDDRNEATQIRADDRTPLLGAGLLRCIKKWLSFDVGRHRRSDASDASG